MAEKALKIPAHILLAIEGSSAWENRAVQFLADAVTRSCARRGEDNPFSLNSTKTVQHTFPDTALVLVSRYKQLSESLFQQTLHEMTLTDYLFAKDKIFAASTSTRPNSRCTIRAAILEKDIPKLDYVVYLSLDRCAAQADRKSGGLSNSTWISLISTRSTRRTTFLFHFTASPFSSSQSNIDFVQRR